MKDKTPNKDRKKNGVQDATQKRRVRKLTLKGFLTAIVIAVMIRQIFMGNYENVFMCGLTLVLFAVPLFIDRKLGIVLTAVKNLPLNYLPFFWQLLLFVFP